MELGLEGRAAIVTGGSKGLGRAIAEELAREGSAVAICARHEEEPERAGVGEHDRAVLADTAQEEAAHPRACLRV